LSQRISFPGLPVWDKKNTQEEEIKTQARKDSRFSQEKRGAEETWDNTSGKENKQKKRKIKLIKVDGFNRGKNGRKGQKGKKKNYLANVKNPEKRLTNWGQKKEKGNQREKGIGGPGRREKTFWVQRGTPEVAK